jgi:N-methylhydantoinase B
MGTVDPITFEVIRNALTSATEEMALTLRRTAYSTNIKTRADFSCAFFDADLRSVAQAFAQPTHLGSLPWLVPRMVRDYGPERLGPGDGLLGNDPYGGGVHLNDITLVSPVYGDTGLFGYLASLAHHVDVGGGAPASIGAFKEVYQEGVIIPPVKLVERGNLIPDIFRLVLGQIRSKHETAGDFRAQIAANVTGAHRIGSLLERFGGSTLGTYVDELIAYTERRARAELQALPRGTFRAVGSIDNDGYTDRPVRLPVEVTIGEEGVLFDFTGSEPQRRAPVNATYAQTYSACAYVLKCLLDPDIPVNAGFYRLVRLIAPAGSVVNCSAPAPVVAGWETSVRLTEAMFHALAPALPERMPAGTKGMICHAGFGGITGGDVARSYFCFLETIAGGYGGRAGSDGPDAVQTHGQNTENAPIEETERNYPVRIVRYGLVEDSEGAGEFRGGLGVRRDYLFPESGVTFTVLADRDREGPWGLFGGLPGSRSEYILNPDGESRHLGSKSTVELEAGDVVSYRTSGGGGYGPPDRRDPTLVLRDVRDGKVSIERARVVYGVAIDPKGWAVDDAETERLRGTRAPCPNRCPGGDLSPIPDEPHG